MRVRADRAARAGGPRARSVGRSAAPWRSGRAPARRKQRNQSCCGSGGTRPLVRTLTTRLPPECGCNPEPPSQWTATKPPPQRSRHGEAQRSCASTARRRGAPAASHPGQGTHTAARLRGRGRGSETCTPRSGCKACAGPGSGDSLHTHPASAGSGCCAPVARRAPPHTNTSLPARGNATMLLSSCGSRQGAACNLLGGLARGPPRRPSLHASLPAAGGPRALRSVITRVSPTPQLAARTLSPLMRTAAGRRRLAPPCPSPDGATCSPS